MKSRPKYQWPANRITPEDMAILYHLREQTGLPINQLLKEAIGKLGVIMRVSSAEQSLANSPTSKDAQEVKSSNL